ncbi:MAG: non-canonical purine NTP pyrophosphatase [Deltaproteobacteria bacterium]|nr:non-canonical purine NTP pyrophosphatase [Deltaproteobacteria bacterium]
MLVAATNNPKKLREIREIVAAIPGAHEAVRSAGELGLEAPEETGDTFEANAILKAVHAFEATGAVSLADDSGLEVDALGGAPGVFSARYAGPDARDEDNNRRLVAALAGVPPEARAARYRAVIALVVPRALAHRVPDARPLPGHDAVVVTTAGVIEGLIVDAPRGEGGFGYDPHFYYPPAGCTFAELSAADKHAVSHRGQALAALRPALEALFGSTPERSA